MTNCLLKSMIQVMTLWDLFICPEQVFCQHRAGYDDGDRAKIHGALAKGKLKAVVSTSALELGIDIPGLSLCILYGVPLSGSSLRQRYGRVGRASAGMAVIIDDGSPRSTGVFANPNLLWSLPLTRSSCTCTTARRNTFMRCAWRDSVEKTRSLRVLPAPSWGATMLRDCSQKIFSNYAGRKKTEASLAICVR